MRRQIQKDKEQISEKLLELDRKKVLIADIQQKVEQKEQKAKQDKTKIEETLNEISDKERSIRQLHRRLRQFEDDLKAKETVLGKRAQEFAKREEQFRKDRQTYGVNLQTQEKKLAELVTKSERMQAELYEKREQAKRSEIEIAQMTFSRDEAKEALAEANREKRDLLAKLEKESIALFKSEARTKELEKIQGVWESDPSDPVHERFAREAKKFERRAGETLRAAMTSLVAQEGKLARTSSQLQVLRKMVKFNGEKMEAKDAQLAEDRARFDRTKDEHRRCLQEKEEAEGDLRRARERLEAQSAKIGALEAAAAGDRLEHERVAERIKYLELGSKRMSSDLEEAKRQHGETVKKLEDQQKTALRTQYELQASQQSEQRLSADNKELKQRRKQLEDQLASTQRTLSEVSESAAQAQTLAQSTPTRSIVRGGMTPMTAATPGTKLLGTIDSVFGPQGSGAHALETGNRLRLLSQILQKGNRQLKRLKALASGEEVGRAQQGRLSSAISSLEDELPDLVNAVRSLAMEVSSLGRYESITPEFFQRVEEQEQAASKWEFEVHQVIEAMRGS